MNSAAGAKGWHCGMYLMVAKEGPNGGDGAGVELGTLLISYGAPVIPCPHTLIGGCYWW